MLGNEDECRRDHARDDDAERHQEKAQNQAAENIHNGLSPRHPQPRSEAKRCEVPAPLRYVG
jgi:hypothetical protein